MLHLSCTLKGWHTTDITLNTFLSFPFIKHTLGRPRRRWEDNIKMDLEEMGRGCGDWMELAHDRDR